ncbi:MAG: OST3/OST6 family protein [Candidatus Bathyarchaeota archaeon]|nr:OST3/OST6 family protein [Candidatus Termiticorpusculum sp.]
MSKKDKKQTQQKPAPTATQSSVSFSLNKWFKKVVTTYPSAIILTATLIGYAVFLLGGGLFTVINKVPPSMYYQNNFYFLYPGISDQFVADTVISVMLYLIGFTGLLTIYQSTKNANKPRQAYMLLIVGASLVLLSYIFLESAINIKITGIR